MVCRYLKVPLQGSDAPKTSALSSHTVFPSHLQKEDKEQNHNQTVIHYSVVTWADLRELFSSFYDELVTSFITKLKNTLDTIAEGI